MKNPVIVWFKNDLRLSNNPAFFYAWNSNNPLIPIYVVDEDESSSLGAAQLWWRYHSLHELAENLAEYGLELQVIRGKALSELPKFIQQHQATALYFNQSVEPQALKKEYQLSLDLSKLEVALYHYHANCLIHPSQIKNQSGQAFKIFTPYWKFLQANLPPLKILPAPKPVNLGKKINLNFDQLLPAPPFWAEKFAKFWQPGARGAQQQLNKFIQHKLPEYLTYRDYPQYQVTSELSPHLHFGELSIAQIWQAMTAELSRRPQEKSNIEGFLRQLAWREFSAYQLYHHPQLAEKNLRPVFDRFTWENDPELLHQWQRGATGYPLVDAGMRELWATGTMHNRVRMVVASFLVKDLLIDWRQGEQWFWDTLLDADLANNAANWQWVAGTGIDSAPYFRIFNPELQSRKFDPNGIYLRKWLPELAQLPDKYLHSPWTAPADILLKAKIVLGKDYPMPIVDHQVAKLRALKIYKKISSV